MSRFQCPVLAFVVLAAAVPARDSQAEGVAGPYIEGDEYNHPRPGERPIPGWNPLYYPDLYKPHPEPFIQPGTPYQKVWIDGRWQYLPIAGEVVTGGGAIQTSPPLVSPATPITTAIASNALPYSGPGVTIRLEEQVGGSVNYLIDGRETAKIEAGQQQKLTAKGSFEIRFSRGAAPDGQSYGEARYTLGEGTYFFTVTDRGWDLLRDPSQPTVPTPQVKPASPSGLTTTPLPPKGAPQPGATAVPAQPATASEPPANAVPPTPAAGASANL